jgi:hypothetical protein
VPCVDGSELARLFFTFAGWSVQPCVRPVSAAHEAAGHNAFRGSGPGQKPAFEMHWHMWVVLIAGSAGSALRAVRPPNLHITPDVGAISVTPQVRRVPCSAHPWPSVSILSGSLFQIRRDLERQMAAERSKGVRLAL